MATINLAVVSGQRIIHAGTLNSAQPVYIQATKGARYVLLTGEKLVGPQLIGIKRVGQHLWLLQPGEDSDKPQLVIENYYDAPGDIIGRGEDQQWHEYVSVRGNTQFDPQMLQDGQQSSVLLSDEVSTPLQNLSAESNAPFMWGLLGVGAAAAAAALILLSQNSGNHEDNNAHSNEAPAESHLESTPAISPINQLLDDVGDIQGLVQPGEVTDDTMPTLSGNGQLSGAVIEIFDNGTLAGSTKVDASGNWTFTPSTELADGRHDFVVVITQPDGTRSPPSDPTSLIIDSHSTASAQDVSTIETVLPEGSDFSDWAMNSYNAIGADDTGTSYDGVSGLLDEWTYMAPPTL